MGLLHADRRYMSPIVILHLSKFCSWSQFHCAPFWRTSKRAAHRLILRMSQGLQATLILQKLRYNYVRWHASPGAHITVVSQVQGNSQHGTDCPISKQSIWLQGRLSNIETECTDRVKAPKVSQDARNNFHVLAGCARHKLSDLHTDCLTLRHTVRRTRLARDWFPDKTYTCQQDVHGTDCLSSRQSVWLWDRLYWRSQGNKSITRLKTQVSHVSRMCKRWSWHRLSEFETEKACVGQVVWFWDKLSDIETDCMQDKACMGQTRTMFIEWQQTIPHKQGCVSILDPSQASP